MLGVHPAIALNEPTHDIINQQATRQSALDQFLREHLAFSQGIEQSLQGRQVVNWLGEGGIREDRSGFSPKWPTAFSLAL
jgi:hypothetical protein